VHDQTKRSIDLDNKQNRIKMARTGTLKSFKQARASESTE
jgi:hypothetical protein